MLRHFAADAFSGFYFTEVTFATEGLKVPHRQPKRERLREAEVLVAAWRDHWNPT